MASSSSSSPALMKIAAAVAGVGLAAYGLDSKFGFSKDIFQMRYAQKTAEYVAAEVEAGRFSQIDRFLKSVAEKPDFPFIIFQESPGNGENVVITYRQADEMSSRLARYLLEEHGVKPGDIISSLHENCPGFVITMLAGWKIGAGLSYLNYNQRGKVLCNTFETSTARVLVFEPGLAHVAADIAAAYPPEKATLVCYHDLPAGTKPGPFPYRHEMVSVSSLESRYPDPKAAAIPKEVRKDVLPSSVASLVFTSGTTGLPKAAIITHLKHCGALLFHYAGIFRATDRIYAVGPCFHGNGAVAIHLAYGMGTTVCMTRKFSAGKFFKFCAETGVNSFPYVGEFMRFLAATPVSEWDRKHQVRECLGNGVRPDFWRPFSDRFGIKINEFYTAVEANVLTVNFWDIPGAVGFQGPLFRWLNKGTYQRLVQINAETEELIRDPKTGYCIESAPGEPGEMIGKLVNDNFLGYFRNEAATKKKYIYDVFEKGDIWIRSGDLLMRDKNNVFWFQDRLGDTYRWKGENVSTMEVRDAMLECPVLQDANIYGVVIPGREDGRAGMAAIILKPDNRIRTDESMLELGLFCGKILPAYAVPRFCRVFETFEATSTVTFKYTKNVLQAEGFDPAKCSEPLFFYVEGEGYVPLTPSVYREIVGGKAKL